MQDYAFAGGTAVVTGAAGGIGEALAHGLAARGSSLALLDRDAGRLGAVARDLRAAHPGLGVATYVADLADRAETEAAAQAVRADHPDLTLLVNNAGVALGGRFDQVTLEEFGWVVEVNFRATVHLTHRLLPALKASPGSHLANVSSAFGFISPPRQSAYSASKFAVRGFTEALRAELLADRIGVTSVHPGGTRTHLPDHTRAGAGVPAPEARAELAAFRAILTMSPEHVAEGILRAVEHRRPRAVIGITAKVPDLISRLVPAHYTTAMALFERVLGWGFTQWLRRRRT